VLWWRNSTRRLSSSLSTVTGRSDRRHGFGRGDVLVLVAALLWSINIVVVKVGLANCGPLTYATLRFLLGGLVLWRLAIRV
jgi:drug/metabolite transporter (DMT)-like permease